MQTLKFLSVINWKWSLVKPHGLGEMHGKNVVITGATDGIGFECSCELAKLGANIFFGARNETKAQNALKAFKENSVQDAKIVYFPLELESLKSVNKFAEQIKEEVPHIDVLINNAGLALTEEKYTEDGFERTFQINHLSHFYLTHLLKNHFATSGARILNTSSLAHHLAIPVDVDVLTDRTMKKEGREQRGSNWCWDQYCITKLLNILFTIKMKEIMGKKNVDVYSYSPGIVATSFSREFTFSKIYGLLVSIFYATARQGAYVMTFLAGKKNIVHNEAPYWDNCRVATPNQQFVTSQAVEDAHRFSLQALNLDEF